MLRQFYWRRKTSFAGWRFSARRRFAGERARNARRLLGPHATAAERDRLSRAMLGSFYLFCCDIGQSLSATPQELAERIDQIDGHDLYLQARARRRGVIILTAHMGSFEVGMAALRRIEPRIHVLFQRDAVDQFERRRSELRRRLDVSEAALDEGWTVWMRLRDALLADEAVVLQGDRVLPGQKGQPVPFLGGHIELPLGPLKLAKATGSPIVPVLSIRAAGGKIRLFIEEPIWIAPDQDPQAALLGLGRTLEKFVRRYPQQWLILHPALCEDQAGVADAIK